MKPALLALMAAITFVAVPGLATEKEPPPPADVSELPRFDPPGYCRALLTDEDGVISESLLGSCLRMEQEAYDNLKSIWTTIPEAIRLYCAGLLGEDPATPEPDASYSLLESCVGMEMEAAAENADAEFRF